jgi:uncharacterized protein (DUF58 family)
MNKPSPCWETINIRGNGFLIGGLTFLLLLFFFIPNVICQFICLFLLFILTGSRFYSEYLIRNIKVCRRDSELRVFRYEWVKMEIKVENYGLLPAFMLVAGDSPGPLPIFKNNKTLCTLSRRSWTYLSWEGHCPERGKFTLGPAYIYASDPLGLFPFKLIAHETTQLFVYPVYRSISVKAPGGIPLGNIISSNPLFEDITHRRSLRPYQKGDEPRRINWKISARMSKTGDLMVNEYEARASYPLMIFLNTNRNEYPQKKQNTFIERTIEAAAALCLRASLERQELGIIIYISNLEEGISVIKPASFTLVPILERLAILDWKKNTGTDMTFKKEGYTRGSAKVMLDQGKYLSYGTRFFYTGPDLGDEAYISLNSLKRHHLSLEYLIIDDRAMPSLVPGNSRRYQMKEKGREII